MRLLLVQNLPPADARAGGGQRVHSELTLALREAGHDARAAFLVPRGEVPGESPDLTYPHWTTHEGPRLVSNVVRMRRLVSKISREWRPHAFYGAAAEAAAALAAMPPDVFTIATSHHYDPPDLSDPFRLRRPLRSLARLRRLQRFYLERWLLRSADLVLAASAFGAEALVSRGYLRAGTETPILHNGVGDEWFVEAEEEGPRSGFLFVGRLDTQKGADLLLEAIVGSTGAWPLTIVGGGWQEGVLRRTAANLGLGERVRFVGREAPEAVRRRMANAGALVAPSRAENYPLVLLEALASGLPVLSTSVGGIPEMVRDGESALLVEPDSPELLARALDRIEKDADLRRRLAAAGRAVAQAHRWSEVAHQLLDHIESRRPRPRAASS